MLFKKIYFLFLLTELPACQPSHFLSPFPSSSPFPQGGAERLAGPCQVSTAAPVVGTASPAATPASVRGVGLLEGKGETAMLTFLAL